MNGKVCVVTGANRGIGWHTALRLARLGAHVVLLCRTGSRARAATASLSRRVRGSTVEGFGCDLSSRTEIRELVRRLEERVTRLDVLIHNAAVLPARKETSVDGIEMQMAVNHLAPFLLTDLLRERLVESAPSRIVVVTSDAERRGSVHIETLGDDTGSYDPIAAYARTKLANVLFTYELSRRLDGTGVTANCLHPGVVATALLADFEGRSRWGIGRILDRARFAGPRAGAVHCVRLASDPALAKVSGKYFKDGVEAESSGTSNDPQLARRLWEWSEEQVARGKRAD